MPGGFVTIPTRKTDFKRTENRFMCMMHIV